MTPSTLKKSLAVLGAAAALSSIAAGGADLAIYEQNPHFGGTTFIAIHGRTPKGDPDIAVDCSQSGLNVKHEKASAKDGGAYFTWSGKDWTGGGASCLAQLLTYDRKGNPKVQASIAFPVSG